MQLDAGASAGAVPQTWEGVCEWVLGRRVDLWEAAFEPVFLQVEDLLTPPLRVFVQLMLVGDLASWARSTP